MPRAPKPVKVEKFGCKQVPPGIDVTKLVYKGEPAKEQGVFDGGVGIADMACVNQFGNNNAKYYHAGVVQSPDGRWFTYYEWGRITGRGKSWNGVFQGGDFQFIEWADEQSARTAFAKQCESKNLKRLEQKVIGGVQVWAAKTDKKGKVKDGYIVQSLATRERGLPDAYTIKDSAGVADSGNGSAKKKVVKRAVKRRGSYQPQVVRLATDLVGGVKTYARAQAAATGITPTQDAIDQVRDQFIPAALQRIATIGDDIDRQIQDPGLIDISKMVRGMVPMTFPVSRRASAEDRAKAAILSAGNILSLQDDLDAFEAALRNEDWDENQVQETDPDALLNAKLTWLDPSTKLGRWVTDTIVGMTRNRHGHLSGRLRVKDVFSVSRPDRDKSFVASAQRVAAKNQRVRIANFANLQPRRREDLSDVADVALFANIFLGIHGTRPVNVAPILQGNLRLPKSLPGAQITGAAFGHGIYYATDWKKSHGYTGHGRSYWASGGQIAARKGTFFLFLCDVIMGDAYMATSTGSWSRPPQSKDSVAALPSHCRTLANDEHIIFDSSYQRIRYVVEADC
jgi:hypothetical protein